MAKKIEEPRKLNGWVDDRTAHGPVTSMEWTKMFFRPIPTASLCATLVIHDGPSERVYLESEVRAMRWIPVEERLPEDGVWVLAMTKAEGVEVQHTVACIKGVQRDWVKDTSGPSWQARALNAATSTWHYSHFTHWMPLPEAP